ncbi:MULTISPECIES: cyanophycin synthetase [Bacillus]|uniref:cyanophycin synthetase n=1 Tax=Bacillus TaxID=1386 RepID=UPI000C7679DC|nr:MULTISPECIES: cyanophycin synthetase [Bacillus]PLR83945.1 cyanophycin synthetase [Bacillus sp. V33-4]RSK54443.1 cyanophycin synthetase [Bacillus canaveralius]
MKINRVRYLKGPNYFSIRPTMWIELDLEELESQPSHLIPGFNASLLAIMPTLRNHTCSLGYEGGFVERLEEGTWMGHILEHMAIELQSMAGIAVKRGKTITSDKKGTYFVTYDYKEPYSGEFAFRASVAIIEQILAGRREISTEQYVSEISRLYYQNKLGPSTEAIFLAAEQAGIPVERVGEESLLRLGSGSKQKFVQATITSQTSLLSVENACDKQMTKLILSSCGVPVPEGEVVSTFTEIFQAADRLGFPLVIKPLKGRQGQGVITNIKNKDELFNVVNCLDKHVKEFIIERYHKGHDYRLLIVNDKLVAASLRTPPFVIGNGKDSIRTLIELENRNPNRGDDHEKPMSKIPLNYTVNCYLEKFDLTLNSVPDKGQVVQVVGNANLSTGGQAIDVTDEVNPAIKELAQASAKALGLDIAGIDLICKNIGEPFKPGELAVVEVNAAPGIRMHHFPSKGKKRDVGKAIVRYLFETREEAAIPVIAITGTNGKTTTARLVKHFLESSSVTVGMSNSDGIFIGSQCLDEGDCSGPISARKILNHPKVDAAVLETARGGVLREGLAFRYCDVGIVTNVSEDHLGHDGIETFDQLVKLKRLIPEVVIKGGACILNADDPHVASMEKYTSGTVIYTSVTSLNKHIQARMRNGRPVWYVDSQGMIIYAAEGRKTNFLPACDIPITINGIAKHNIANLLQALAAAFSQGITWEELKEKSLTFLPDFDKSKGRFNKISKQDRLIIVDYAHNVAGLRAIYDTIHSFERDRLITVISAPGDRIDDEIISLAKAAARHTDILVIKEDRDLRGRAPFEAANIIQATALREGVSLDQTCIVRDELEAFYRAWDMSKRGDILLFLYENFSSIAKFFQNVPEKTESKVKKR